MNVVEEIKHAKDEKILLQMLEKNSNLVDDVDFRNKRTPLHAAASKNFAKLALKILKLKPTLIRAKDSFCKTASHYAVSDGDHNDSSLWFALHIFDREQNPDLKSVDFERDREGNLPIHYAVRKRNAQYVGFMLFVDPFLAGAMDTDKNSMLLDAIQFKNQKIVDLLLYKCPQLASQCSFANSPLGIAVGQNNLELVRKICHIDQKQITLRIPKECPTPLQFAIENSNLKIVEFFLNLCPQLIDYRDTETNENLLFCSTSAKMSKLLLLKKPDLINGVSENGSNVLSRSVYLDYEISPLTIYYMQVAPCLLFRTNDYGDSAIDSISVSMLESDQNARHLLFLGFKYCPTLKYRDQQNNTALHAIVIITSNKNILARVFANCTDNLFAENRDNKTPFDVAIERNNKNAIELFKNHFTLQQLTKIQYPYPVLKDQFLNDICKEVIKNFF